MTAYNSSLRANQSMPYRFAELFLSYAYGFFFVFGGIGNIVVWGTLCCIFAFRIRRKATSHVFVYSTALTIADSMQLMFLPLVISDILCRNWIFGVFLCKAFTLTDAMGKLFSPFILTLLSFDRFAAVCFPHHKKLRRKKFATLATLSLLALALCLTIPLSCYTTVVHVPAYHKTMCTQKHIPEWLFDFSVYALVVVGFLCPAVLMVVFYTSLAIRLFLHSKSGAFSSNKGTTRIYCTSALLVAFYLSCYVPYWLFNVALPRVLSGSKLLAYVGYTIHILPYLNSSVNPIFYALLNTELRRTRSEAMQNLTSTLTHQYEENAGISRFLCCFNRSSTEVEACQPIALKKWTPIPETQQRARTTYGALDNN